MKFGFGQKRCLKLVDGRRTGDENDGRSSEGAYTMSSPCEHDELRTTYCSATT